MAKNINNNLLNVHDVLKLMLFGHSRVEEAVKYIPIEHTLYNFIKLPDIQHQLQVNNLIGKYTHKHI